MHTGIFKRENAQKLQFEKTSVLNINYNNEIFGRETGFALESANIFETAQYELCMLYRIN